MIRVYVAKMRRHLREALAATLGRRPGLEVVGAGDGGAGDGGAGLDALDPAVRSVMK